MTHEHEEGYPLGYIYFVQAYPSGLVKIGCTRDLKTRLQALASQNSERLELLAAFYGFVTEECSLHQYLRESWDHAEWFRPSTDVLSASRVEDSLALLALTGVGPDTIAGRKIEPINHIAVAVNADWLRGGKPIPTDLFAHPDAAAKAQAELASYRRTKVPA